MSRRTKTLHALLGISLALVDFALFIFGLELLCFLLNEWVVKPSESDVFRG